VISKFATHCCWSFLQFVSKTSCQKTHGQTILAFIDEPVIEAAHGWLHSTGKVSTTSY